MSIPICQIFASWGSDGPESGAASDSKRRSARDGPGGAWYGAREIFDKFRKSRQNQAQAKRTAEGAEGSGVVVCPRHDRHRDQAHVGDRGHGVVNHGVDLKVAASAGLERQQRDVGAGHVGTDGVPVLEKEEEKRTAIGHNDIIGLQRGAQPASGKNMHLDDYATQRARVCVCVQMYFMWTFQTNTKCNNINHV